MNFKDVHASSLLWGEHSRFSGPFCARHRIAHAAHQHMCTKKKRKLSYTRFPATPLSRGDLDAKNIGVWPTQLLTCTEAGSRQLQCHCTVNNHWKRRHILGVWTICGLARHGGTRGHEQPDIRAVRQSCWETLTGKLNWPRADSKQQASLQHSGKKYELHSADHRRRESVWAHGCWESQATSWVLETRGETGVQCSGVTLAQRCHDCRS